MLTSLLLALAAIAATPWSRAAAEELGILTFTVDNATSQFFTERMPVFFEHNVPGTLFGQAVAITCFRGDLCWNDLKTLKDNGWEFGAHGYSHRVMLAEADDDALELELGAPAAFVYRGSGVYPTTFASPHGSYDKHVLDRVKVYYDAHVRGWGNDGINLFNATDHYQIYRERVENTKSTAEVCADIEKAGREGYWLVLMWHRVVDVPTYQYENSAEQFEGVVSCAAEMRDKGIVRIMTVKEALQYIPDTPR